MSQSQVHEFNVEMTCSGCSGAVEKVLGKIRRYDKVQSVRIELDSKKVLITSAELGADELLETLKKTGKTTSYVGQAN